MPTVIENIILGDSETTEKSVEIFIKDAAQIFTFPELNEGNKRVDLWNSLCSIATATKDVNLLKNCFIAIRILSREKHSLRDLVTEDWLLLIKKHIGLKGDEFHFVEDTVDVALEAQKSLCNIVFNSRQSAEQCCRNGILDGIVERIKKYKTEDYPDDIKFFDMKLLFLITALCPEIRMILRGELQPLMEMLERILKESAENHSEKEDKPLVFLNDKQVDIVCELLKALFNLTIHTDDKNEEGLIVCNSLMEILRNYLLISTNSEKKLVLHSNIINLLTNMPNVCYQALLIPVQESHNVPKSLQFEGQNMTAIYEILMFLKAKFDKEPTVSTQHELLSPVVTVLLKGAQSNRAIRKFLRIHVLPPLRDVHTRPEQGGTIRNHLCRLLTTPITQLRDLVAELLFVLCKKNVTRMIKYTGYGNACGLFAQKGLLAGGRHQGEADFSSDSDSETEEYADHKHGINPVLGCYEEPHPNVMETMTEEQKEYEAMKLVELMDSLMKCGTIKPCRIGEDGKPQPIEHVLQLQETLNTQEAFHGSDSE